MLYEPALQCISHLPYLSVNNNDFMDNYTKYFNGDNKLIDEWINIQILCGRIQVKI